jgi:hypothetical protein
VGRKAECLQDDGPVVRPVVFCGRAGSRDMARGAAENTPDARESGCVSVWN